MNFLKFLKQNNSAESKDFADKVFIRSVVVSLFALSLCLIVFSTSTWAWLTDTIAASEEIKSSIYVLTVTVTPDGAGEALTPTKVSGMDVYDLEADKEYTVTALAVDDSVTNAQTGYFKIKIGNENFFSEQIDRGTSITFTLKFTSDTTIEIVKCWGTSSVSDAERDIHDLDNIVDINLP